ncbi:hypothetical protein Dimus_017117 [Dionaea muscipula]
MMESDSEYIKANPSRFIPLWKHKCYKELHYLCQSLNLQFLAHQLLDLHLKNFAKSSSKIMKIYTIRSWHLDGYAFWPVAYGFDQWNPSSRKRYNKVDAPARHTVQVYPKSWNYNTSISLDSKDMWNLRSAIWPRQYLRQQLYLSVWNDTTSRACTQSMTFQPMPSSVAKPLDACSFYLS